MLSQKLLPQTLLICGSGASCNPTAGLCSCPRHPRPLCASTSVVPCRVVLGCDGSPQRQACGEAAVGAAHHTAHPVDPLRQGGGSCLLQESRARSICLMLS